MNVFAELTPRKQSGAALLAFLLVFVTAASFALLKGLNETATKQYRDAQTVKALAEAKAALIGYAAGANIVPDGNCGSAYNCPRPGDLPCPDRDNDGDAENQVPGCGTASGGCPSGMPQCRLGRLPWKTLRLPDLRDGSGERLWYAVSDNFKLIPRRPCGSSGSPECLHSGTHGTITVRNANEAIRHNGTDMSGAIAVVFAPGPVLRRQGATFDQNRACTNCDARDKCLSGPPTVVPRCDPENYLDTWSSLSLIEDNQDFVDNSDINGFIEGPVFDAQGNLIINDKLAVITYENLMPLLEKRVVGEVTNCLDAYAQVPTNLNRYPWAAKLDTSEDPEYGDDGGLTPTRFGRVPDGLPDPVPPVLWAVDSDEQFTTTRVDSGNAMAKSWPLGKCLIVSTKSKNTWWLNWKESVFYGVADAYIPGDTTAIPTACATPGACLTVLPTAADAKFVVIAAGRSLAGVAEGQLRADPSQKGLIDNYLEPPENTTVPPTNETFASGPVTPAFNDVVCKDGSC
ncbi:hypothetical protein BH20PSE1_BH20PSE1_03290 [soil metagenome]